MLKMVAILGYLFVYMQKKVTCFIYKPYFVDNDSDYHLKRWVKDAKRENIMKIL